VGGGERDGAKIRAKNEGVCGLRQGQRWRKCVSLCGLE